MHRRSLPLDAAGPTIQPCEPRLALSASPGADLVLEAMGLADELFTSGDAASESLWEQAEALRSNFGLDGSGQTVAVIDSGIAYDHLALGQGLGAGYRVVGGWDFAEDDADPYDDGPSGFHGTHVAGTIAADGAGITGLAPGADLVALRVFDDFGTGQIDWVEQALDWVVQNKSSFANPITTVNLSLGALIPDDLAADVQSQLEDELAALNDAGIVVVAAAGNHYDASDPDRLTYPASSPHVAAVTSLDVSGSVSSFAQRSDGLLAAVGERVVGPVPEHVLGFDGIRDDTIAASGTSMAAPQVAAGSMLVRQALDQFGFSSSPEDVLARLHDSAEPRLDAATGAVYHELNLTRAIEAIYAAGNAGNDSDAGDGSTDLPAEEFEVDPAGLPMVELGTVEDQTATLSTSQWTQVEATRDGTFSIVFSDSVTVDPETRLIIQSRDGVTISNSAVSPGAQIDLVTTAKQPLQLRLAGVSGSQSEARLINLFQDDGHTARVFGTAAGDDLDLNLAEGVAVSINGAQYASSSEAVLVNLGAGSDRLSVTGSAEAEKVELRVGEGQIERTGLTARFEQIETVTVHGGGGPDRAYLYDSASDDSLTMRPGTAELSATGYAHAVKNIDRIYVFATAGGDDSAFLHDSPADDRLSIRPDATTLRGDTYFNRAFGFDRAYAYATAGGTDHADLYDSSGDDRLTANDRVAWIRGPGYFSHARHFESVVAHATAGGNDTATIYSTDDHDVWLRSGEVVKLDSPQHYSREARGFESSFTFSAGQPIEVQSLGMISDPPSATGVSPRLPLGTVTTQQPFSSAQRAASAAAAWTPIDADEDRQSLLDFFAEFGESESGAEL